MLEHLLAAMLTLAPTAQTPDEQQQAQEETQEEAEDDEDNFTVEIPPQDPPQLSLRVGMASIDGRSYELLAPSFTISGLSIEVRYHKQSFEQRQEGTLQLSDIDVLGTKTYLVLHGQEKSIEHQLGFNFGLDLPWRKEKRYLRVVPSVHLMGGMEMEVTEMKLGEENLPRKFDLNFFVGLGVRTRVLYPLSHKIRLPVLRGFEAGLGVGAEYRRRDIRDIGSGNDDGNSYALEGYAILVYVPDKKQPMVIPVSYTGDR